jgi:anaerobic ribonucleoside-triphosphate reductase
MLWGGEVTRHDEALAAQERNQTAVAEKLVGKNVGFERTRRITGYLSPVSRWNNAKKAELKDRRTHV